MKRANQLTALSACLGMLIALTSLKAAAQIDLTGVWVRKLHEDRPEIGPGPGYGQFTGLPINDDARQRGLSWHPSLHNVPEHQCIPLGADHGTRHSHYRIWKESDPVTGEVIAWRLHKEWQQQLRTIWMDGRDRPPEGTPHTFQGFSTGEWVGDILVVTTTHLKEAVVRRNGVPRSDQGTVIEHYIRHGEHLTLSKITKDPVYLTEPLIHTSGYIRDLEREIRPYPCEVVVEIATQAKGYVPHFLPWNNPRVEPDRVKRGLPVEAWMGGAETMYPDYRFKIYPDYLSRIE